MYIIKNDANEFVNVWKTILNPDKIEWILDERQNNFDDLLGKINKSSYVKINEKENCYAFFSDPSDVARMESRTYICSLDKKDSGPTNNWHDPKLMFYNELLPRLKNVMMGRTMYIIPFVMGKCGSQYSRFGIQITDEPYVCINMKLMTRVGQNVLNVMDKFIPCIHTSGSRNKSQNKWNCSGDKFICHFPDGIPPFSNSSYIISYGSSYGGNAILSKKCLALRIASKIGKNEGWMAEHCLILKITSPSNEVKYVLGSFPSSCGKTNLAMIVPPDCMKDWKFETIGDDIAWIFPINGKLYATNVENGFFGVAPGTSLITNKVAIQAIQKDSIFTNCSIFQNDRGNYDIWWEGLTSKPPLDFINWKGERNIFPASHPNARYTVPLSNCPIIAHEYEKLVPISAIIFGGRREDTIPLVSRAENIYTGIFYGASLSSEETSANIGNTLGNVRFDPMSMRPFIGYNVNDYLQHWINIMEKLENPPDFYLVNWFRKENGNFLWKGFSDNALILKWIFENKKSDSTKGIFGLIPTPQQLNINENEWNKLFHVTNGQINNHKTKVKIFFNELGNVPQKIYDVLNQIKN